MDFDVITISSKGQIVIPKDLRKGFRKGDKLLLAREGNVMFLRHAKEIEERLAQDKEFARVTEAALERYVKNPSAFRSMSTDQFLKELDAWQR